MGKRFNIPSVVACGARHISSEDFKIGAVLRAIANRSSLSEAAGEEYEGLNGRLISEEEVKKRFAIFPEAIKNACKISSMCGFDRIFDGFVFPEYACEEPPSEVLRKRAISGAEIKYGELSETVLTRLDYELEIINSKGFASYFLTVADIVSKASRICGRGSGAASLVAYSLGISNVDPIKHNLYFERFLNPERDDPPDIDIDFAWDERDKLIGMTMKERGLDRTAMVCNHITYRFRSALRDTARVFGMPEGEINRIQRFLSVVRRGAKNCEEELSIEEPWPEIIKIASRLVGFPRHIGVHVGGLVITPRAINEYAPIETAAKGIPVIAWEKEGAEAAGLVKIDMLGNRSLAAIRDALSNIRENGYEIDEQRLNPLEDYKTRELLARGESIGVFYVESPAMRQLQKKTGAGDFESVVIHSSIIRPAANKFISEYVRRLRGEKHEPLHPLLEEILKETYGIMCYQEDVSKTAIALAGFSQGEADGLRKILSKKDRELKLPAYKSKFYEGAKSKGAEEKTIDKIWRMIASFDGYSFCKPHSASFAMVSFQSAYIKAHFPAEFISAILSNGGGYYSAAGYIGEARRMGLTILPPDVNFSRIKYFGRKKEARTGLMAIGGLREELMKNIVEERNKNGLFKDLEDFKQRAELTISDIYALAEAGALNSISEGLSQPEQIWRLLVKKKDRENKPNSGELFASENKAKPKARLARPTRQEILRRQFQRLGFLCEEHPFALFEKELKRIKRIMAKEINKHIGKEITLAGWLVTEKTILTSEGEPMEFVTFEDETDIYETVLFPEAYKKFSAELGELRPFLIKGRVQNDMGAIYIVVSRITKS